MPPSPLNDLPGRDPGSILGEMAEESEDKPKTRRRKPIWRRKRWWILAVLLGGLVWLDGPI